MTIKCPVCQEGELVFDRVDERKTRVSGLYGNFKTKKEKMYKCNKEGCPCELNEKDYQAEKELQRAIAEGS